MTKTWGGKRPGAGSKKKLPPNTKRRTFNITDDEWLKVKELIKQLRSESK